uniref:Immunoglobulin V-set domain-containing protein n=1 Tax=Mola mola TaxID=94237 RepID=A0A3Q3XLS4_MOLML
RPLLAACCYLLLPGARSDDFLYQDIGKGNGNGQIFFSGIRLHVEALRASVSPSLTVPRRTRVKWSWLPVNTIGAAATRETEVIVATGNRHRSYGSFRGRVHLRRSAPGDLSLVINELRLNDTGRYRCEVIDGLEDQSVTVELELQGVCVSHVGHLYFTVFGCDAVKVGFT